MRPRPFATGSGPRTFAGLALLLLSAVMPAPSRAQAPTPAPPPVPPASRPAPAPTTSGAAPAPTTSRPAPAPAPTMSGAAFGPTASGVPPGPPSGPIGRGPIPMPESQPHLPSVEQRSGLIQRFVPIEPTLPHDRLRDTFYDTRWADHPDTHPNHPNKLDLLQGGLFGRFWPNYNTASFYPYFFGSPGNSLGPGSKPWPRLLRGPQSFVRPFRPIGYYYDQGSLVPIYDPDPLVPGPGANPYFFPFYLKLPLGH